MIPNIILFQDFKESIISFFKPKDKNDYIVKLNEISQSEKNPLSEFVQLIKKINICVANFFTIIINFQCSIDAEMTFIDRINSNVDSLVRTSRTNEALRTQEHLLQAGSQISTQKSRFIEALGRHEGQNIKNLAKELKEMKQMRFVSYRDLEKLRSGQSLWINAAQTGHTMIICITKSDDGKNFNLQFSNTGFDLDTHPGFHPQKTIDGKNHYQTVALIENIPLVRFREINFFSEYSKIAFSTIPNPGNLSAKVNNKLYHLLGLLGNPIDFSQASDHQSLKYFSRIQRGGSCSITSMIALSKVKLTKDELNLLKTDMRLKSLYRNYRNIKTGFDESYTAKILILDQIQKLKVMYNKKQDTSPQIFDIIEKEIAQELKNKQNTINPEVRILPRKSKILANQLIPTNNTKIFNIAPCIAQLTSRGKHTLSANVDMTLTKKYPFYQVLIVDPSTLKGQDLYDQAYLLYYHIATGNQRESYRHYMDVMETINSNPEFDRSIEEKAFRTSELLLSLASQLSRLDTTRSGIAKSMFLYDLSMKLLLKQFELMPPDVEGLALKIGEYRDKHFNNNYQLLNVEKYLPEDHLWVLGRKKLYGG